MVAGSFACQLARVRPDEQDKLHFAELLFMGEVGTGWGEEDAVSKRKEEGEIRSLMLFECEGCAPESLEAPWQEHFQQASYPSQICAIHELLCDFFLWAWVRQTFSMCSWELSNQLSIYPGYMLRISPHPPVEQKKSTPHLCKHPTRAIRKLDHHTWGQLAMENVNAQYLRVSPHPIHGLPHTSSPVYLKGQKRRGVG